MALPPLQSWGVPFAAPAGRVWPVAHRTPAVSYTLATGKIVGNPATAFHAPREGGKRHHAGVDLLCLPGDRVVAMEPGRVLGTIPGFVKLGAVVVEHPSCLAVYAEVALDSLARSGLKPGSAVAAGQTIAFGAINYEEHSMLHLETWAKGRAPKAYTPWWAGSTPPPGLLDPTRYLLALAAGEVPSSWGRTLAFGAAVVGAGYALYRWIG